MSFAVLRSMLLALARDRAALALSFLLPVAFFIVFAAIFGGASGDAPRLDVALADESGDEAGARLIAALARDPALRPVDAAGKRPEGVPPPLTGDQVRELVRSGKADVGLIVRQGAGSLAGFSAGDAENPPLTIVEDAAKGIAGQILLGLVQKAYFGALPDAMAADGVAAFEEQVGPLTEDQRTKWNRSLEVLRQEARDADKDQESAFDFEEMIDVEQVAGRSAGQNQVAYYAGAVAVMFLLFASVHGAAVLLEEREAGILDRILAGPGGMAPVLAGKFLFLVLSGYVQVTMIYIVAWLIRGVDLPGHFAGYSIVTLAAAIAASGLGLALTALCTSRRQAGSVSTIVVLILSAVGGSMVPRFFMPPLFRTLGWATPNTWALEAYAKVFWRDEPLTALAVPVGALVLAGVVGLVVARQLLRRWECV